jgi:hypothetical protein
VLRKRQLLAAAKRYKQPKSTDITIMTKRKIYHDNQPFAKLKELFSNALADTKTPHLILPNRTDTTNIDQHNYNFV